MANDVLPFYMARARSVGAVAAIIVAVWWLVAAGTVSACSCLPRTEDELFDIADVVFVGTLEEIRVPDDLGSFDDSVRLLFAVSDVYKGEAFEQQSVVTARDGATCGLAIDIGQTTLVFASTAEPGLAAGEVSSHACAGTRSLGLAPIPDGFGSASAPTAGSSGIGSDGRWWLDSDVWLVAAITIAVLGLAGVAGIALNRRARSA